MIQIIPSILVPDEATFIAWSQSVEQILPMIQLDIADGKFVPNDTWADPDVVSERLHIDCELHLMVEDPLEEIRIWEEVPQVKRVLVHYESDPDNIADILCNPMAGKLDLCSILKHLLMSSMTLSKILMHSCSWASSQENKDNDLFQKQ